MTVRWTSRRPTAALSLAAREQLDNLVFVISCNLQRLDGPVRGNSKIIQELESVFRGAGWNVVKVIWAQGVGPAAGPRRRRGARRQDEHHQRRSVPEVLDRDRRVHPRATSSAPTPVCAGSSSTSVTMTSAISVAVATTTASSTARYRLALEQKGAPTAILAHTVKGWTLGSLFEGRNATHQIKKIGDTELEGLPRQAAAAHQRQAARRGHRTLLPPR